MITLIFTVGIIAEKYNETMDGVHLKFARMLIWFMRVFDLFLTEVHFEDG